MRDYIRIQIVFKVLMFMFKRIEAFWGILRRWNAQFWINLLKDMVYLGEFDDTDNIHR